ncbi:MAG: site-2 protease family protein [Chloroflexi bacterium]|nr:site-2 protease family protein [Chloroflexota bacterium]MYC07334.1 site-2 protease family protein [Chloroflexota bacterium]
MLFRLIDQFLTDPFAALISLAAFAVALIVGITVHEFSHAWSATQLGDHTARDQGRLTLNPVSHLDPIGTILIFVAGFGWGKPTPVTPAFLRIGERPGMAVVALAGPISNVVVATLAALPFRLGTVYIGGGIDAQFLQALVLWNVVLALFNLLPIAPLDGFKVALGVLPRAIAAPFARTERFGMIILLVIVLADSVLNTGILSRILFPAITTLVRLLLGV